MCTPLVFWPQGHNFQTWNGCMFFCLFFYAGIRKLCSLRFWLDLECPTRGKPKLPHPSAAMHQEVVVVGLGGSQGSI